MAVDRDAGAFVLGICSATRARPGRQQDGGRRPDGACASLQSVWWRWDAEDLTGGGGRLPVSCPSRHRGHAGSRRPEGRGWSSPNDCAASSWPSDRRGYPRCFARPAPRAHRGGPRAADCRRRWPQLVGSKRQGHARTAPAIRTSAASFSPLMSWTIAEPGQVSRLGITRPTPLPERVGAKHSTCSEAVMPEVALVETAPSTTPRRLRTAQRR